MTAINITTDIPPGISTLEQLHAWSGLLLHTLNPTLATLEAENLAQFVVQTGVFSAADNTSRLLIRSSLQLDPNFVIDTTAKLWMSAKEFSNVSIPAAYKSN